MRLARLRLRVEAARPRLRVLVTALARRQIRLRLRGGLGRGIVGTPAAMVIVAVSIAPIMTSAVMPPAVMVAIAVMVVTPPAVIIVVAAKIGEIEIITAGRTPGAVAPIPRPRGRVIRARVSRPAIGIAVIGARETLVCIDLAIPVTKRICAFGFRHILAVTIAGARLRVAGRKSGLVRISDTTAEQQ